MASRLRLDTSGDKRVPQLALGPLGIVIYSFLDCRLLLLLAQIMDSPQAFLDATLAELLGARIGTVDEHAGEVCEVDSWCASVVAGVVVEAEERHVAGVPAVDMLRSCAYEMKQK